MTDRRLYASGRDAILQTPAGIAALRWNYVYDGNWSLLFLEAGLVGMLALAALFLAIHAVARGVVPWLCTTLNSLLIVVVAVGFFAAVLQGRTMAAVLPVFVGLLVGARVRAGSHEAVGG